MTASSDKFVETEEEKKVGYLAWSAFAFVLSILLIIILFAVVSAMKVDGLGAMSLGGYFVMAFGVMGLTFLNLVLAILYKLFAEK